MDRLSILSPGEPPVLVDSEGRVIRSPETEAEIAALKSRVAELEAAGREVRKKWVHGTSPEPFLDAMKTMGKLLDTTEQP